MRIATAVCLASVVLAQQPAGLITVGRIKTEAFDRSKVMEHLLYLTDIYGPRLTASPEFDQAAGWAMKRLTEYGVQNVHLEKWGPFGRSWSVQQFAVEMIEPRYSLLSAAPLAWSAPTNGPVTGELILAPFGARRMQSPKQAAEQLEAYRKEWAGKLRGKIVLVSAAKIPPPVTKPLVQRYTDAELSDIAKAPDPTAKLAPQRIEDLQFPEDPEELGKFFQSLPESVVEQLWHAYSDLQAKRARFFHDQGALGILTEDPRAHDAMAFAESAGSHLAGEPMAPPSFVLTAEHYNRLARALEKKVPVRVRLNLKVQASDADVQAANIIGEIPGSGRPDEIVMIGAHFDSWHSGTGSTDNGAGSAVMIEVMRILKALNFKLDRTVRIGLWAGEEQGLLGSKAYVKQHFGDPGTMKLTAGHAKLSGYFNLDNGSGKIRGVYLQGNDAMRPLFERWLAPFRDEGVTTISIRNTGGTDHLSFDAVGLPGFQFIQDPLDYGTVTHHSNMDTYDHAVPADLMQAAAVIASVVYAAANNPELLPRK